MGCGQRPSVCYHGSRTKEPSWPFWIWVWWSPVSRFILIWCLLTAPIDHTKRLVATAVKVVFGGICVRESAHHLLFLVACCKETTDSAALTASVTHEGRTGDTKSLSGPGLASRMFVHTAFVSTPATCLQTDPLHEAEESFAPYLAIIWVQLTKGCEKNR